MTLTRRVLLRAVALFCGVFLILACGDFSLDTITGTDEAEEEPADGEEEADEEEEEEEEEAEEPAPEPDPDAVCCFYADGADDWRFRWASVEECEGVNGERKDDDAEKCDAQAREDRRRDAMCCCQKTKELVRKSKNKCPGKCHSDFFEKGELVRGTKCTW